MKTILSLLSPQLIFSAVLLSGTFSPAFAALILDENFENPSFDAVSLPGVDPAFAPDDTSSSTFSFASSGGNPDGVLNLDQSLSSGSPPSGFALLSAFEETGTTYNPSLEGEVAEIQFSLDVLFPEASPDVIYSFITFFVHDVDSNGGAAGPISIEASPNWQTITINVIVGDFFTPGIDFAGSEDFGFGFGFLSGGLPFGGPTAHSVSFDNFRVETTVIPEPGSALLLGIGLFGLSQGRRRP